jgi:hypothetical protein
MRLALGLIPDQRLSIRVFAGLSGGWKLGEYLGSINQQIKASWGFAVSG